MCKTATLKRLRLGFEDQLSLNAGQKYCRMLQREHSAILSTFIKLPIVLMIFVLSIFTEVLLYSRKIDTIYIELISLKAKADEERPNQA